MRGKERRGEEEKGEERGGGERRGEERRREEERRGEEEKKGEERKGEEGIGKDSVNKPLQYFSKATCVLQGCRNKWGEPKIKGLACGCCRGENCGNYQNEALELRGRNSSCEIHHSVTVGLCCAVLYPQFQSENTILYL